MSSSSWAPPRASIDTFRGATPAAEQSEAERLKRLSEGGDQPPPLALGMSGRARELRSRERRFETLVA